MLSDSELRIEAKNKEGRFVTARSKGIGGCKPPLLEAALPPETSSDGALDLRYRAYIDDGLGRSSKLRRGDGEDCGGVAIGCWGKCEIDACGSC
jgi:hypothetical protein